MINLLPILFSGVTLVLPMDAEVSGTEITLGEVARIQGATGELALQLDGFELGYAPAPGYSRLLFAERIKTSLKRKFPDLQIELAGERACRVRPKVRLVAPAELRAAAEVELRKVFGDQDASFQLAGVIEPVAIPAGSQSIEVRAKPRVHPREGGATQLPIELVVDGVPYRTVWTTWQVEVWHTVPVLRVPKRAGQLLDASSFEVRRVPASMLGAQRPLPVSSLHGAVAGRDLIEGSVVTRLDVHRPVLVEAGNNLFLLVKKGPIEARVPVVAMESGAVGDRIRVRTDTGRDMTCLVLSRDLARIDLR